MKKRDNIEPDDNMRMFVGLDVHKKYTEYSIVGDGVVTEQERIENEYARAKHQPFSRVCRKTPISQNK